MYRKGLSSRENKVSSLVASTDNSGAGMKKQDLVPSAGAHGIRKSPLRFMPLIPQSKNKRAFSKLQFS